MQHTESGVDHRGAAFYGTEMAKLRLGIVGVGKHGSRYAKHAAEDLDDVQLVAVCRRDELRGREVATRYGCAYMANAHDLVARRDIDAVVFATVPSA